MQAKRLLKGRRGSVDFSVRWGAELACLLCSAALSTACRSSDCRESATCSPENRDGDSEGGLPPLDGNSGGPFGFVQILRQRVMQDGVLDVVITLDRPSTQTEDISVKLSGLIEGLTFEPLTINGKDRQGRMTIRADGKTQQGPIDLTIQGSTASGITASGTLPLFVRGKPGTVDPTFGNAGRRVGFNGGGATDSPTEILVGPNDQLVLVGPCYLGSGDVQTCAARMSADGELEPTYGGTGRTLPLSPQAAALDSAGRVVAAGWTTAHGATLARFTAAGGYDRDFGHLRLHPEAGIRQITGMAACPNDIAVVSFDVQPSAFAVKKFSSAGTPVGDFGTQGFAQIAFPSADRSAGVICHSDGSVRIAGVFNDYRGYYGNVAAQLTATGGPDARFSAAGKGTFPLKSDQVALGSIVEFLDGRTAVAGWLEGTVRVPQVVMIAAAGDKLDPAFGTGGVAQMPSGAGHISDLAVQPDGKLVAAFAGGGIERLVRLGATGVPDATFGGTGDVRNTPFPGASTSRVAIQSDGRIVVAGRNSANEFYVVRYWD